MKDKYEVTRYIGVPVDTDQSGNYIIKKMKMVNLNFTTGEQENTLRVSSKSSVNCF